MIDAVRPEEPSVGPDLSRPQTAPHNAAPGQATTERPRESGDNSSGTDPIAAHASRLARRLGHHLHQEPPELANVSALSVLELLNQQVTELLDDLQETCLHLRRLSEGEFDTAVSARGPGTQSVRELRHRLRDVRVRMAAMASGDATAHENGGGLLGAELSQLHWALHGGDEPEPVEEPARPGKSGSVHIKARGTMDALSASLTLDDPDEAFEDGTVVMLDMSDISYVDPAGIGLIRRHAKKLELNGGSLVLIGVQETVKETIRQLGLAGELACFPSAEGAQRALQGAGGARRPERSSVADSSAGPTPAALPR